jgi:hypothetical protein
LVAGKIARCVVYGAVIYRIHSVCVARHPSVYSARRAKPQETPSLADLLKDPKVGSSVTALAFVSESRRSRMLKRK